MINWPPEDGLVYPSSSLVGYVEGELFENRHKRRQRHAVRHVDLIKRWCDDKKVEMEVKQTDGQTVIYLTVPNAYIQWTPFSGRVHFCCDTRSQPHRIGKCHDYEQFVDLAGWWYSGTECGFVG